jgi:uncharacterized protein (TIGR00297 family)
MSFHFDYLAILEGLILCGVFGWLSLRTRIVDESGLVAGFAVGSSVFIFPKDGWKWFTVILVFHLAAAQFTKYKYEAKRKRGFAQEKGGARTWQNVFANGGVAASLAIGEGLFATDVFLAGFIGAVGTATADTLATEIGLLYQRNPRSIANLRKKIPPGTSGGVSPLGEFATLLGSFIIGLTAWLLGIFASPEWSFMRVMAIALISGFLGCTVDSIIGATVQGMFRCSICSKITESKKHCGEPSIYVSGCRAIDNNLVNFISTGIGALVAVSVYVFV